MVPLALTLVLAQAPVPKAKVPEVVVPLQDRSIALPRLPGSASQGRARFKEVHAQVAVAMADLNASLQALYGRPEARPLPVDLSVPVDLVEEGSALVKVLDDETYVRLERAYLDTWKALQAALVEGGAARKPAAAALQEPRSKEFRDAKAKALALLNAPAHRYHAVTRGEAGYRAASEDDTFTPEQLGATPLRAEERAAASQEATSRDLAVQNRVAATDLLLPDLSERWNALSDHLGAVALGVLNRQSAAAPTQDGPMTALRTHAQLAVLERYRKALFYCDLVWCQLASAVPPPAPPRLAPPR